MIKASQINATEDQVRTWFQNRRRKKLLKTGKPCKRIPSMDSESELSDNDGTILIPPPTPNLESSEDVSEESPSRITDIKSEKRSSDLDLKTKKDSQWKIMKDLNDVQFIQQFYVCDFCELRKG